MMIYIIEFRNRRLIILRNLIYKIYNKFNNTLINSKGLKRKFLFYGMINVLLTNMILQIMLLCFDSVISTFVSQAFNSILGFILYGKKVFGVRSFMKLAIFKYMGLSLFVWNLNWIGITLIGEFNINKNISAIIMIPFLAGFSFYFQKYIVYK